jgi:hypothetical protein
MIALRIIHVVGAILWAGGATFFAGFVGPTVETLGPGAGPFFTYLVRRRRAVIFFLMVSSLTALSGALLYWRDSHGLDIEWIQTGFGTGLTVGGVAGLLSWILVLSVVAPTTYRMTGLGERIAATGSPPSEEQAALLSMLQRRLKTGSVVIVVLLAIAAVAMATARYLVF